MEIRETSDGGRPVVVSKPDAPNAKAFVAIAKRVWEKVSAQIDAGGARQAPKIVMQ
jgi:ATP-binding protein involved in chromosome partitioning